MKATAFAAAIAFLCFATPRRLHGPFLYDDAAAIQRNPVVNGHVPLHAAMALDFWGEEMSSPRSHKSFRPLVTLSFRLSRVLQWESDGDSTFGFHLFNAGLHAFVTGMVPAFVNAAFGWRRGGRRAGAAAALLFALHPVHVEAVQNVVSRGELMMAAFYLAGFLGYAHAVGTPQETASQAAARSAVGLASALLGTLCATLCKETGVTLPLLCAAWELLVVARVSTHRMARLEWPFPPARPLLPSAARLSALAAGNASIAVWRLRLNEGQPPAISTKQNWPGFYPHPLWRPLSVAWVWLEYASLLLFPSELCCDWSAPALPPITSLADPRLAVLAAAAAATAAALAAATLRRTSRRCLLSALTAALPFLLASNLLFPVGTCKAERVLYLPSLGGCMLAALALLARPLPATRLCRPALLGCVCAGLAAVCWWYADVWTDGVALWANAVAVQDARAGSWLGGGATTSALSELGMQLSWAGRGAEAVPVLHRALSLAEETASSPDLIDGSRSQDMSGYVPLAIALMNEGQAKGGALIADRCVRRLAGLGGAEAARTRARCLATAALTRHKADPERARKEALEALRLSPHDAATASLARQALEAVGVAM